MARQNELVEVAEGVMIEAWQLLMRLPDRERSWLKSGSRGSLPAPVRDRWLGTIDAELALELGLAAPDDAPAPRPQLGRREMALVRRAWWQRDCLAEAVLPEHRKLFAMVIAAKAGRQPGGFRWSDIWVRFGGNPRCGFTKDTLRSRYEASLGRVAVRLALLEGRLAA